jgi:hypothetical protein
MNGFFHTLSLSSNSRWFFEFQLHEFAFRNHAITTNIFSKSQETATGFANKKLRI